MVGGGAPRRMVDILLSDIVQTRVYGKSGWSVKVVEHISPLFLVKSSLGLIAVSDYEDEC